MEASAWMRLTQEERVQSLAKLKEIEENWMGCLQTLEETSSLLEQGGVLKDRQVAIDARTQLTDAIAKIRVQIKELEECTNQQPT
jgi:uncharacterized protein YydD (DUF2326 family)